MLAIEGSEKAFSLDDVAMNLDDLRGIAVESVPSGSSSRAFDRAAAFAIIAIEFTTVAS